MAAPTIPYAGWELTLAVGGNAIGCDIDATLSQTAELLPALCKSNQSWETSESGRTSWNIGYNSFFEDAATPVLQKGSTAALTIGGVALKGWDSLTLTLEADVIEAVNKTTGLAGLLVPTTRRGRLSVSGDMYDPLGTGADALMDLQDYVDGTSTDTVAVVLTYGDSGSMSFDGRPTKLDVGAPVSDMVQFAADIAATGTITDGSTNEDPGIGALLAAFFGASGVTSVTALLKNQSTYSQWTGSAYPTQITLTIPYEGNIQVAGQLLGSGALTHGATS